MTLFFKRDSKKGPGSGAYRFNTSTHVYFSYHAISDYNGKVLEERFAKLKKNLGKIKSTVTTLDLDYCNLGDLGNQRLMELFELIPKHITHLNLKGNLLHRIDPDILKYVLQKRGKTLTHLNLADNHLGEQTIAYQKNLLCGLSRDLIELDYSNNRLYTKVRTEQQEILSSTPKTLKVIDLSYNGLDGLSVDEKKFRTEKISSSTAIYFAKVQLIEHTHQSPSISF